MNKNNIILLVLITCSFCLAYDWSLIGPDTIKVNDYLSSMLFGNILCVSDGLLINDLQGIGWDKYTSAMMPAIQAIDHDTSGIMIILSDSSWSNGTPMLTLVEFIFTI